MMFALLFGVAVDKWNEAAYRHHFQDMSGKALKLEILVASFDNHLAIFDIDCHQITLFD